MDHATFLAALGKATAIEIQAACAFAGARELSEMIRDRTQPLQSLKAKLAELKSHPGQRGSVAMRENIAGQIADIEREIAEHTQAIATIKGELANQQDSASTFARQRDATREVMKRMRKEFDALKTRELKPIETTSEPGARNR